MTNIESKDHTATAQVLSPLSLCLHWGPRGCQLDTCHFTVLGILVVNSYNVDDMFIVFLHWFLVEIRHKNLKDIGDFYTRNAMHFGTILEVGPSVRLRITHWGGGGCRKRMLQEKGQE